MKKMLSFIAVLALVCFTTTSFAAEAPKPAAAKPAAPKAVVVTTEPAKAPAAKYDVVIGKVMSIDKAKGVIVVKAKKEEKTIVVKPEDIGKLKKGEMIKVALTAGTNNAAKVRPLVEPKKPVKKATSMPAGKKAK
ncbi:MAG TPA: hypothetical protein VMU10_10900 [Desulfomonilia bacterium]|nr:hypothetical protein [Desulfomonilia bacterium]